MNHYDILDVEPTADLDTIRQAWRLKVRLLHPDKHRGSPDDVQAEAAKETLRVNRAWATLRDPDKRRGYDRHLGRAHDAGLRGNSCDDPSATGDDEVSQVPVCCAVCKVTQRVPRTAGRFECLNCKTAWQFAKCDGCNKIAHVRERRTNWRCVSCGRRQNSSWACAARYLVCVRCKSRTRVADGIDRFNCVACGLEHLRCSCGEYRMTPILRWRPWRCPKCGRVNQLADDSSFDVAPIFYVSIAIFFMVLGLSLLAGLFQ